MRLAGTRRTGATRSRIVMVKLFETWFPPESVTSHVTVVVPTRKNDPDGGAHSGVSVPSILSVAVGGRYLTIAPGGFV